MSNPRLNSHLDFLDLARGFAVFSVYVFHCLDPLLGVHDVAWTGTHRTMPAALCDVLFAAATFGKYGVAIFFALSGFCIHLSFSRSKSKHWSAFFVRRAFRILPAYWLWLCLFSVATWATAIAADLTPISIKNVGMHGLLIQNFRESIVYSINPSFWSLAVEAQLYLLYPLLIWMAARWGWGKSLMTTILIEIGFRLWVANSDFTIRPNDFSPLNYWGSWVVGAFVAQKYVSGESLPWRRLPLSICIGGTVCIWFWKPSSDFVFLAAAFCTAVWLSHRLSKSKSASAQPQGSAKARLASSLSALGLCSYSFYLIHQPILLLADKWLQSHQIAIGQPANASIELLCFSVLIVPLYWIAQMSYHRIEMRSHNFGIEFASRI